MRADPKPDEIAVAFDCKSAISTAYTNGPIAPGLSAAEMDAEDRLSASHNFYRLTLEPPPAMHDKRPKTPRSQNAS
jgi:hypothetical protein